MPLILGANSVTGGYEVDNSLRFNTASSDNLTKTGTTGDSRRIFTHSVWVKKCDNSTTDGNMIINSAINESNQFYIELEGSSPGDDNDIRIRQLAGGSVNTLIKTSASFRDVSAWYHIVVAVDTTQATASNRIKLYVNGSQITAFDSSTYPSQNTDMEINTTSYTNHIGKRNNSSAYFNGYMSEFNFIDGQQLAPSDFGEFDEDSGIWKPIAYTGTYGTNGFFLEFKDSSALGDDTSGNSNDFTVNNLTSIDQTTDTPTNNFATMNPLDNFYGQGTFSEGNLQIAQSDASYASLTSTIGVSSGKWYAEIKWTAQTIGIFPALSWIGIVGSVATATSMGVGNNADSYSYIGDGGDGGKKRNNGSSSSYGDDYAVGDIIGIALDLDNNKIYWSKNGTFQNSGDPTSGSTGTGSAFDLTTPSSGFYYFAVSDQHDGESSTWQFNFGNPPFTISSGNSDANNFGNFEYAVPSGYYALCTKNLAEYG
jgi:hypothetical protein